MDLSAFAADTPYKAEQEFDKLMKELAQPIEQITQIKERQPAIQLWKRIRSDFPDVVRQEDESRRAQLRKSLKDKLRELEQLLAGQMRLFAKSLVARVLARYLNAVEDPKVKRVFNELNAIVDGVEGLIQKDIQRALGIKPVSPKTPTKRAPKTYAQAQAEILDLLKKKGWTVVTGLKVPHATSPDGRFRYWFRAQAIYYTSGKDVRNYGEARSTWVPDYRHMTIEAIVAHLEKYAKA